MASLLTKAVSVKGARNTPSLHRSQIFRDFVSDAGSRSRILRLRRPIPLLFKEKNFKTVYLNSFILNPALRQFLGGQPNPPRSRRSSFSLRAIKPVM
jgi:hypothetical protein